MPHDPSAADDPDHIVASHQTSRNRVHIENSGFGVLFFRTETACIRESQAHRKRGGRGAFEKCARLASPPTPAGRPGVATPIAPDVNTVFRFHNFFDRGGNRGQRRRGWGWGFAEGPGGARTRQGLARHPVVIPVEVVRIAWQQISLRFGLSPEVRAVVVKRLRRFWRLRRCSSETHDYGDCY